MPQPYAPVSAPKSSMPTTANLPQPRDVALPDFTSNTFAPFFTSVTGDIYNNRIAVWTPKETRFVLRGGYVHVICGTTCTGTAAFFGELFFYDEVNSAPVLPITTYWGTTPAGWINAVAPWHFDLGKGYRSKAKNNRLMIGGTVAIGAGVFICSGLLWGIQE